MRLRDKRLAVNGRALLCSSDRRFLIATLSVVLAVSSATVLAQGQMRESPGPGADNAAPTARGDSQPTAAGDEDQASADDESDSQRGEDAAANTEPTPAERNAESVADRSSKEIVQPDLVKEQQRRYKALRETWRRRILPDALESEVGEFTLRDSGVPAIALRAHNIEFYLDDGIGYKVRRLKALLEPNNPGEPVNFDNPEQFTIHILSGEVLLRPRDLDALFNRYVLDYQPRALSSVANKTAENTLTVEVGARLFEFIPPVGGLPTTLSGPVSVTDDNRLVYAPDSVKQFGLPVKPLLSAVGLKLQTLTPFKREGVALKGDRLIMDPETMFPPPRLKIDKLTDVTLSDAGLALTFGSDQSDGGFADPPVATDSYIWLQAGDARFYSTLLVNANLQLMGNSDAPLRFNLYHYRAQSAAGTINARMDGALIVRVPNEFEIDDNDVHQYTGLTPRYAAGGD